MSPSPEPVVLITGGTAGLGAACARAFAPTCRLALNYSSNATRAEALQTDLSTLPFPSTSSAHPRIALLRADISSRTALTNLVTGTIQTFGRLDIVISNAGWTRMAAWRDLDLALVEEDWDRCFAINVKAHLWLAHAARPWLEKSEGAFIATASTAGMKPGGSSLAYSVTKAAQIHLVKALALIMAPRVRCNTVAPGLMMTEWAEQFPQEVVEDMTGRTPLGRTAEPGDVAEAVRGLAFNRSVTGQNMVVDGGFVLG